MDRATQIEVLSNETTSVIVRTAGRRYAGVVVQGDRLGEWVRLARSPEADDRESLAEELAATLRELRHVATAQALGCRRGCSSIDRPSTLLLRRRLCEGRVGEGAVHSVEGRAVGVGPHWVPVCVERQFRSSPPQSEEQWMWLSATITDHVSASLPRDVYEAYKTRLSEAGPPPETGFDISAP